MRVGANVRQFHRIKKMHGEGVPAEVIAGTIPLTPQSLEKILAHIDGRPEVTLAVEENAEVQALRLQVADQAQKLAKFEEPTDGETIQHSETEKVEAETTVEGSPEVESSEEISTEESA